MKSLYVGNLDSSTTEQDLRDAFAVYGDVQMVSLITDQQTAQPRGFAFVEMENDKEANEALLALNGATLCGATLTVNEARPRAVRGRR